MPVTCLSLKKVVNYPYVTTSDVLYNLMISKQFENCLKCTATYVTNLVTYTVVSSVKNLTPYGQFQRMWRWVFVDEKVILTVHGEMHHSVKAV